MSIDAKEKCDCLLKSTLDCDLSAIADTETVLYSVPLDKTAIITKVVMRSFSEDCTTAVVTFGKAGGTADEFLGDQTLTGITAGFASQCLVLMKVPHATIPVANTILIAEEEFAMEITTPGTGTCTIDVFGYIY
jgi:hypothetical protein